MPALADILRQCREIVAADYPLSRGDLVAAIDAELAELVDDEHTSPAGQRCDAAGRTVFPVSVRVQSQK
jgi:hypothetical protein